MKNPNDIADLIIQSFPELNEENDGEEISFWASYYACEPAALSDKLAEILSIDRNKIFDLL